MKRNLLLIFFVSGFNFLLVLFTIQVLFMGAEADLAFFLELVPMSFISALLFTLFTRYWNKRKSRNSKEK